MTNPAQTIDTKFQKEIKTYISHILDCSPEQVYCVWSCKTLQHIKGLFSSDVAKADGKYYEATYNGDKKEYYLDEYTKDRNTVVRKELG